MGSDGEAGLAFGLNDGLQPRRETPPEVGEFHWSEDELSSEQDADADPEDLSIFLEHVVLLVEVVGQFNGSREDFVLAALGGDVGHGNSP